MASFKKLVSNIPINLACAGLATYISLQIKIDYGWLIAGGITFVVMSLAELLIKEKENESTN